MNSGGLETSTPLLLVVSRHHQQDCTRSCDHESTPTIISRLEPSLSLLRATPRPPPCHAASPRTKHSDRTGAAMATTPQAAPVGEDAWLNFVEEERRTKGRDLNSRVEILERYKQAVSAELGSIKLWIAYCEYFWSLYLDCYSRPSNGQGLSTEEIVFGREVFSLDAALSLWQQAYEATRYRLSDSHELWNRWISLEMDLLARSRTNEGVVRITHLFRNRLVTAHKTWDDTSQMFSTFLSDYNRAAYESTMQEITAQSRDARKIWEDREIFELKLSRAQAQGNTEDAKAVMLEYLDWEMRQNRKDTSRQGLLVEICLGLYSRALTGLFCREDSVWTDYVVWLSSLYTVASTGQAHSPDLTRILPNLLDTLQRAVSHCPWTGTLWARYILSAEEAGLSYDQIERIKHAATASDQLDKAGMAGVIDMYAAWCGFLKRRAMTATATDEDSDVAEIGLLAALEDVEYWGKREYGNEYKGDPSFRLERILIQYLTEKKATVDNARHYWNELAKKPIYADSYNFWMSFYMWEMSIFSTHKGRNGRSPTPAAMAPKHLRIPSLATHVLARAVKRPSLDWPEKVFEIYLQHCNDYEPPETVRRASDTVHKGLKAVKTRRQEEQAAVYSAQMAQYQEQAQTPTQAAPVPSATEASQDTDESSRKRTRDDDAGDSIENSSKRIKQASEEEKQRLKRDRENTSIYVSNLPADVTQTKVRQYFRDYGHIRNLTLKVDNDQKSAVCLIEFDTPDQVESAILKDGKYFGQEQISVKPATGTTLYVTNYPPHADEKYIRDLFKDCGEIFSIRWPSLKYNTHRRFCYVSFRTADASAKAIQLDGKMLEGRFRLEAKYSNPAAKKQRDGAIEEGREVHVTGVPQEATEDDIKSLFQKYGAVERLRILTNKAGKSRGSAFVAFEDREQAERAIKELDKTKFNNQILTVEKSTPTNFKPYSRVGPSPSPSAESSAGPKQDGDGDKVMTDRSKQQNESSRDEASRTFAVLGVPDTVNDARLRAFVGNHGHLTKLTLRPDHGGAILEFADPAIAGKAQLSLDGAEIEGRTVRTGSVAMLFKEKGETKMERIDVPTAKNNTSKPTLMAPPSTIIRRPALGGGRGGKRGLGIPNAISSASKQDGDGKSATETSGPTTNPNEQAAKAPMKSNDDFRALLLSNRRKEDTEPAAVPPADAKTDGGVKMAPSAAVENGSLAGNGNDH